MRFIFFFLCSIFAQLTAATWSPPIDLPSSVPQSSNPVVAINSSGKAVAVWIENGTTANAAIFNGSTWTATSSIPFAGNVNSVQVVIDEAGNATALAIPFGMAGNTPIEGAVLPSGSLTWSSIPNAQTGSNSNPLIGIDGLGNVFAMWTHTVAAIETIQTAILNPLTLTWSAPFSLDATANPAVFDFQGFAVNSAGEAIAVWRFQSTFLPGNMQQLRASSYSPTTMMWTFSNVNASSSTVNGTPSVGIDSVGNGIIVWTFGSSLVSSNFTVASHTWSSTLPVTALSTSTRQVAMDPSGNAWTIFTSSNNVYATHLAFGAGSWTNEQQLNISGQSVGSSPIALNSGGAGLAVWEEIDNVTTNVVLVSALLNVGSTTWNTISPNITTSTSESNLGALAFSNNGTGVVDWINSSDVSPFFPIAQAAFFPFTSALVEGMQIANRFLTQTDFVNIVTWAAPFGFIPVRYNIFRDAALTILAGSVPAPTLEFEDHNRKKKTIYTYFIIAVDQSGNTRSIGTVTVNPNS